MLTKIAEKYRKTRQKLISKTRVKVGGTQFAKHFPIHQKEFVFRFDGKSIQVAIMQASGSEMRDLHTRKIRF